MQLLATPTHPSQIALRSMLDIAELPDEYAVLVGFDGSKSDDEVTLWVLHEGRLYSIRTTEETPIPVVTYTVSNALEASTLEVHS